MNHVTRRRIRNISSLVLGLSAIWWWVRTQEQSLGSQSFSTGYILLGAILFLALYNVRKKLPSLPLGRSTGWLQLHLYVGVGTAAIFVMHAGAGLPTGILDSALAATYVLTVVSGVFGLYLTRTIPSQLTRVGEEFVYERIPTYRRKVRHQAREVVLESISASGATMLADFYASRLYDFFGRSRGLMYFLRPTTARRRALMREMQDLRRYLAEQEQAACEKLFALVRRKDDLDFHEARQRILKLWLFFHIGLTYALVLLALIHGLVAHAFSGGVA
jgi:hypothetical protein